MRRVKTHKNSFFNTLLIKISEFGPLILKTNYRLVLLPLATAIFISRYTAFGAFFIVMVDFCVRPARCMLPFHLNVSCFISTYFYKAFASSFDQLLSIHTLEQK
jgi:hypothetical protein